MTYSHTLSKLGLILMVIIGAFWLMTGSASAYSYYQPTSAPVYQYQTYQSQQQPVYYYQYPQQNTASLQAYLNQLRQQLVYLQSQYQNMYGHSGNVYYTYPNYYRSHDYEIDVDTEKARNVEDDEATLYGDIDLDGAPYAYVWFEYGENGRLNEDTKKEKVDDDGSFHIDIDDLDEDERYYFRAVAEDSNGDRDYGEIRSFEADDDHSSSDDDEPDVETGDANDIEDDSAEIEGEVDMNDFSNGIVFFVWGEDENDVEDVEDEDRYNDIDEDSEDLQKEKVDSDLDGDDVYTLDIDDLDDDTEIFYRICVEYEDDDDDDTLECGDVESFETDD